MAVVINNNGGIVEHIAVRDAAGNKDVATVQPGGKITLPKGFTVTPVGVSNKALLITGNEVATKKSAVANVPLTSTKGA
jgi:hypothetical protein